MKNKMFLSFKNFLINKMIVIVVALLCLSSCASKNNTDNYILFAKSSGSTIEIAQANALASLSNMIFVNIQTSFNSQETLNNDKFDTKALNTVNLSSQGYLKGYTFFDEYKETKNVYSSSVGITLNSLIDNIEFLKSQINEKSYGVVDKYTLIVQRDKLNFLVALLNYAKANQFYEVQEDEYNKYVSLLNDLNIKIQAGARLKFIAYPNDVKDVELLLNNKSQNLFSDIYLNSGTYTYKVQGGDYMPQSGVIELSKGSSLDYTLYLQKKLPTKAKFKITINNTSSVDNKQLLTFTQKFIANNQGDVVDSANDYNLVISLEKEFVTELSKNFFIQNLPIKVEIFDNNNIIIYEDKLNSSYVSSDTNKDMAYKEGIKNLELKLKILFSMLYNK